jgi:hypothetical protein
MLRAPPPQDPRMQEPVASWITRATGCVLFLFGVLITPISVLSLFRFFTESASYAHFWLVFVFSLIAVFCLVVGGRMIANCPNAYGSLLSPVGWYILASFFWFWEPPSCSLVIPA